MANRDFGTAAAAAAAAARDSHCVSPVQATVAMPKKKRKRDQLADPALLSQLEVQGKSGRQTRAAAPESDALGLEPTLNAKPAGRTAGGSSEGVNGLQHQLKVIRITKAPHVDKVAPSPGDQRRPHKKPKLVVQHGAQQQQAVAGAGLPAGAHQPSTASQERERWRHEQLHEARGSDATVAASDGRAQPKSSEGEPVKKKKKKKKRDEEKHAFTKLAEAADGAAAATEKRSKKSRQGHAGAVQAQPQAQAQVPDRQQQQQQQQLQPQQKQQQQKQQQARPLVSIKPAARPQGPFAPLLDSITEQHRARPAHTLAAAMLLHGALAARDPGHAAAWRATANFLLALLAPTAVLRLEEPAKLYAAASWLQQQPELLTQVMRPTREAPPVVVVATATEPAAGAAAHAEAPLLAPAAVGPAAPAEPSGAGPADEALQQPSEQQQRSSQQRRSGSAAVPAVERHSSRARKPTRHFDEQPTLAEQAVTAAAVASNGELVGAARRKAKQPRSVAKLRGGAGAEDEEHEGEGGGDALRELRGENEQLKAELQEARARLVSQRQPRGRGGGAPAPAWHHCDVRWTGQRLPLPPLTPCAPPAHRRLQGPRAAPAPPPSPPCCSRCWLWRPASRPRRARRRGAWRRSGWSCIGSAWRCSRGAWRCSGTSASSRPWCGS